MKLAKELLDLRESGIMEIIRFFAHPTFEGMVFVPMFILYNFAANMFAACSYIPVKCINKFCTFLWEQFDDLRVELSRQHMAAIHRTPCLWSISIFK